MLDDGCIDLVICMGLGLWLGLYVELLMDDVFYLVMSLVVW